jgi:type IV fimbrial biogenesis protein FimT
MRLIGRPVRPSGRPSARGMTLIELVTCLAVAAVLGAVAYPSLLHWRARMVVGHTADLLVSAIETARVAALAWRAPVTLSPLPEAASLSRGWRLRLGAAGRWNESADDRADGGRVLSVVTLPDACLEVTLRSTAGAGASGTLTMTPVGYSRTERGGLVAATFMVRCRDVERQVRLGAQGRLRVCTPGGDADCEASGNVDAD